MAVFQSVPITSEWTDVYRVNSSDRAGSAQNPTDVISGSDAGELKRYVRFLFLDKPQFDNPLILPVSESCLPLPKPLVQKEVSPAPLAQKKLDLPLSARRHKQMVRRRLKGGHKRECGSMADH